MAQKLYVRRGGGASGTATDYMDRVAMAVVRKGAPVFDGQLPLIQMGRKAADGEASQGYFKLVDPEAEIHSTTYRLSPHALVTWTEDASGDELWLARGRIAPLESGRRAAYIGGTDVEWDVTINDNNMDLRGQAFSEAWVRPSETDTARILALHAYTLNSSSSTATHHRNSCDITCSTSHLMTTAFNRTMPARTYPAGTQPQDVIAECAERSGKTYAVVIHHTGGSSHDCLLYVGALDHATYVTDVKISDQIADWDLDSSTAPVFPPVWDQGKGTLTENDEVVSGVVVIYGGTTDAPLSTFVHDPADETPYEYWVNAINDDKVDTLAEADNLASTYFTSHRAPGHRTHRFSVKMLTSQHHLITAGMSIQVKSAVLAGGADLGTYVWRRITELRWEPDPDPRYIWARISLEKVLRRRGLGAQPTATTPTAPPPFVPPAGDSLVKFYNANDAGGDAINWAGILENQGGTPGQGANGTTWYHYKSNQPYNYQATWAYSAGDQLRVSGYIGSRSIGRLSLVFTDLAPGTSTSTFDPLHILATYLISPVVATDLAHPDSWTLFSAGPFTAPAGTTSVAMGRTGGSVDFDEISFYTVDTSDPTTDPSAIDYDGFPHADTAHYLPADYAEARLDDLQTQISDEAATISTFGSPAGTSVAENSFDHQDILHGFNLTKQGLVISPAAGWKSDLVESPSVIFHPAAGLYVMTATGYNGTLEAIGCWTATTPDGPWTEYGSNPFFSRSNVGGQPDQNGVTGSYMWWEDGTTYLFYIGMTATGYEQGTKSICVATSTDWVPGTNAGTWTRYGAIIEVGASGTWRDTSVWHPNIVKRGSSYYLFFNAGDGGAGGSHEDIGYATADSLLGPWAVDDTNSPLLDVGAGGSWEDVKLGDPFVYRIGETWWMAYEGYDGTNAQNGLAYTSDTDFPLGWTKFAGNPVLDVGAGGTYDDLWAARPCIWITPTRYYHWYSANDGSVRGIGLATETIAGTGVTDHGALTGLADDDHTQYTRKATLTTTGDIYYASSASTPARLGIGSAGQVLGVSAGVPAWTTPSSSGGIGEILIADSHSTPLVFGDLIQNEAEDDLVYADP